MRREVPREQRGPALLRQRPARKLGEVQLPLDARSAGLALTVDREGVRRAVGERPDLQQREEPVALEHHAPVDGLLAEVVGPGVERLLPAGREQLVHLAAGLREPTIGKDPLLADLHAADSATEPRRAGDDLGHRRAPPGDGSPREAKRPASGVGTGQRPCSVPPRGDAKVPAMSGSRTSEEQQRVCREHHAAPAPPLDGEKA